MKIKKINPYDVPLDVEESELLASFERGEWKPVDNLSQEIEKAKNITSNTLRGNTL